MIDIRTIDFQRSPYHGTISEAARTLGVQKGRVHEALGRYRSGHPSENDLRVCALIQRIVMRRQKRYEKLRASLEGKPS